ncbi:low-density lipoprotein receptor-related protein 2-like isoform X2 [Anneissia japonica]|uniref:low-density lipoprotein receptor-related protein 2-like isoform X2 n=1 Tax=Anneissia japonica TaxID=1529436 RepID=UPI0014259C19|nr:low-density lipoprotein receptor-related protein 2-like isoform X2 [Anneissia japonica]
MNSLMPPKCIPKCLNGGQCRESSNGPFCLCPSTYSGDHCEISTTDLTTYIIIAVVLSIGLILVILILMLRRWKGERQRPRILPRIISVRARPSIKIDKTKDDAPPGYDDVSKSCENQDAEQCDLTNAVEADSESTYLEPPTVNVTKSPSVQALSEYPLLDTTTPESKSDKSAFSTDNMHQSKDDQLKTKSAPDEKLGLPSYDFVQENRASQTKTRRDHSERSV